MKNVLAVRQFHEFATLAIKNILFFNEKLARRATVPRIRNTDDQNILFFNEKLARCATVPRIRNTDDQKPIVFQ